MFSQVTGLYAENHGVLGNSLIDNKNNKTFDDGPPSNTEDRWFNESTPLWLTAEKEELKSVVYFWPGCYISKDGVQASNYTRYKSFYNVSDEEYKLHYETLIKESFNKLSKENYSLVLLYSEIIDHVSHLVGKPSKEFDSSMKLTDSLIEYLIKTRDEFKMTLDLNIILVSDHGHAFETPKNPFKIHYLSDYLPNYREDLEHFSVNGPSAYLWPKKDKFSKVYANLSSLEIEGKGVKVYVKGMDIPAKYHINHERTGDILLVADPGYSLEPDIAMEFKGERKVGNHGWDPDKEDDMQGIFIANGPAFKKGYVSRKGIRMVDEYNVFCHVLGLTSCHANNGSWDSVSDLLVK